LRIDILKNLHLGPKMAPEVKYAKNSKLPKLSENCFEPVGKGGWPPISTWIMQWKHFGPYEAMWGLEDAMRHAYPFMFASVYIEHVDR
jgi:hypothetical protein